MVGQVGDDNFGRDYFEALGQESIDGAGVKKIPGQTTGAANIIVEEETGENRILFTGGANLAYSEEKDRSWDLVPKQADVVVFQLEVPMRVVSLDKHFCNKRHLLTRGSKVLHNMHLARERGKHIIFNPAPATLLPEFAYQDIDTLVMNETEALILSQSKEQADLTPLLNRFLQLGVKDAVIITLGGNGVMYATASGKTGKVAAKKVKVVDTTAAGDTFLGAYAAKRVEGLSAKGTFDYEAALEFATMAAGRTVEKKGAMDAIPRLNEL